jgi:hypothetical protein
MFGLFKSRRAKRNQRFSADFYELNEREMEMLLGGSPVRSLIAGVGNNNMPWQPSPNMGFTNMGFNGASYQPLPTTPYQNTTRQQAPSWMQVGEEDRPKWPNRYYE